MEKIFQWVSHNYGKLLFLYVVIAALWIFGTDRILHTMAENSYMAYLLSFKDWIFIAVSGLVFLYLAGSKRKVKEELTESEKRYRMVFKNSLDGIMLTNPNGEILKVNSAGCRILGWNEEEIRALGRNGIVVNDEKLQVALQKREETGSFSGELTFLHKSGRHIPVDLTSSIYINDKGERRTSLIFRNISDRKEKERLLQEQVKMRTAIMEVGQQAVQSEGLEEFYQLLVEKIDDLLEAHTVQLLQFVDRDNATVLADSSRGNMHADLSPVGDLYRINEPQILEADQLQSISFGLQDVNYSVGIIVPGESNPFGFLVLHFKEDKMMRESTRLFLKAVSHLIGITVARKQAELELKESLEEKKILLSEIHHRIKNNLAVISGLLELQASEVEDEKVQFVLHDSQQRIHTIATIHEKLYQSENIAEMGFASYVDELLQSIQTTYDYKNRQIRFQTNIEDIDFDITEAVPLGLILNEMVSNAYKHAFQGQEEGTITINLTKDADNGTVAMRVADDGKGLSENFDLKQNNSLGMKLISSLTRQLDGTLEFNNLHWGCEFIVTFKQK